MSWTTAARPQDLWVPPTFWDTSPHLRSYSARSWIGHWWEDTERHFPGKAGENISGVDSVLPVCPVLPLHPPPEEDDGQAGARQVERHDPFHRYPSFWDVGGGLARLIRQEACIRGGGSGIKVKMLRLRITVLEAESSQWQSRWRRWSRS